MLYKQENECQLKPKTGQQSQFTRMTKENERKMVERMRNATALMDRVRLQAHIQQL